MNIFLEEHQEILNALLHNQVEFLMIGGYAVIFHGYERTTGDMDLWLQPMNENKEKVIKALAGVGFASNDLNELSKLDFSKPIVFSIGNPPEKIDFMTLINQVSFDEAYRNRTSIPLEGLQIPVINLKELILSKINTGRAKDAADVEELQKILSRHLKS